MEAATEKARSYYSTAELCERWGISRWTLQRMVNEGRLSKSRFRGAVRFSAAAVMAAERKAGR
jgi:excisionase family DNA binding protein